MKNVFATAWLIGTAESILAGVLGVKLELGDVGVESVWSALCLDLVSVRVGSVVKMLSSTAKGEEVSGMSRFLWQTMARNWGALEGKVGWEVVVDFLLVSARCVEFIWVYKLF